MDPVTHSFSVSSHYPNAENASLQNSYTDHSTDYIPKTSSWEGKISCHYVKEDVKNQGLCCSSTKTIDRAINKAYANGIQSHLGIDAIKHYPCVSEHEMGKLFNDLHKKIQTHGISMELPPGLNPNEQPLKTTKEIRDYCKEVVFEKLSRELNRTTESKPIAFTKQVLKYCLWALPHQVSPTDTSTYLNEPWHP